MKLTTVLASVNNNPNYYMFIPKQIHFWKKFNINFIAVFVGEVLPDELIPYKENIILWNKNLDLNTAYVAQNLRMYYTSLLELPDDEMVMITDMDMLPTNNKFYLDGLEEFKHDDFIYFRHVDGNQIYMCYNAAHPKIWSKLFCINNIHDISSKINENYNNNYNYIHGSTGWFIDQEIMYTKLINYENLKILNRPIKRLEVHMYHDYLNNGETKFIHEYDDVHFHRNYFTNETLILDAERQINEM
jgi:hypothetical protein